MTLSVGDKLIAVKQNDTEHERIAIIHVRSRRKGGYWSTEICHQGKIDLSEPDDSEELRLDFEGIHVLSTGTIYAMAESAG